MIFWHGEGVWVAIYGSLECESFRICTIYEPFNWLGHLALRDWTYEALQFDNDR